MISHVCTVCPFWDDNKQKCLDSVNPEFCEFRQGRQLIEAFLASEDEIDAANLVEEIDDNDSA